MLNLCKIPMCHKHLRYLVFMQLRDGACRYMLDDRLGDLGFQCVRVHTWIHVLMHIWI